LTRGFGAVFSDVDLPNTTSISLFDNVGDQLGAFFAPATTGWQTFSFLGIDFSNPIIARVRITAGNAALGPGITDTAIRDVVVMDDFVYGEPVVGSVPEAGSSIALLAFALMALETLRRKPSKCVD
jgi:hypothetical protein